MQLQLIAGATSADAAPARLSPMSLVGPSSSSAPVDYRLGLSAVGMALAAATAEGLCALLLGDDESALIGELEERFPQAPLRRSESHGAGEDRLDVAIRTIDAGPGKAPGLPLDLRGTAFQRRVWTALLDVPFGYTTTYGELASRLGLAATAVRAVAGACGANPVAVLIPCHRVLTKDDGLAGYRWGLERKRALLERERSAGAIQPDLWRDASAVGPAW